jgi:hypothetical protein
VCVCVCVFVFVCVSLFILLVGLSIVLVGLSIMLVGLFIVLVGLASSCVRVVTRHAFKGGGSGYQKDFPKKKRGGEGENGVRCVCVVASDLRGENLGKVVQKGRWGSHVFVKQACIHARSLARTHAHGMHAFTHARTRTHTYTHSYA